VRKGARKRGGNRARGRGRAALALAACAALLGACGSSGHATKTTKYLDVAKVERAIEQSIMSQRHLKATVRCPTKVLQKPGKFACIATTRSVKKPHRKIKTPFVVTVHNAQGYVTYIGR